MGMFNFGSAANNEGNQGNQGGQAGQAGQAGQTGDAGATGDQGGTGNQGQQGQSGQQGNGAGGDPNSSNLNPWAATANLDGDKGGQGQHQQQAGQNGNGGDTGDGNQQTQNVNAFNDFVAGLNFAEGVDLGKAVAEFNDGKPEALTSALNAVGANAFKQSMLMANQLMDKRIEKAVDAAVEKTTGKVNSNLAFEKLEAALPFTADESTQPVARAVMTGFLKQGQDVKTAIQNTGKYFEQVLRNAASNGLEIMPPGGRNNNGPGGNGSFGGSEETPDWFDLLAGNSQ